RRKEIALNEARRAGFHDELTKYLNQEGDYRRAKTRQSGLVAPRFFIPSPAMIAFRKRASQVMAEQRVWHLHRLPGFDEWFADWTRPRAVLGKRDEFGGATGDQRTSGIGMGSAPMSILHVRELRADRLIASDTENRGGVTDGNGERPKKQRRGPKVRTDPTK